MGGDAGYLEVASGGKCLGTDRTVERPIARVCSHVNL